MRKRNRDGFAVPAPVLSSTRRWGLREAGMTIVEREEFTCHVCGRRYACRVVVSTNNFAGEPALPPPPRCPACATPPRRRVAFSPGSFFEILFELADGDGTPQSAIDRMVRWCTS